MSAVECIILYIYMHPEKHGVTVILLTRKKISLGESCSQPRVSEKTHPSETGRFKPDQLLSPGKEFLIDVNEYSLLLYTPQAG